MLLWKLSSRLGAVESLDSDQHSLPVDEDGVYREKSDCHALRRRGYQRCGKARLR